MTNDYIDYGNSRLRLALTWSVYPLLVVLPIALLILNFEQASKTVIVTIIIVSGFIAPLTLEFLHPHCQRWLQSHDDLWTDICYATLGVALSSGLKKLIAAAALLGAASLDLPTTLDVWPESWPLWIQSLLALAMADLGAYCYHRSAHETKSLWRLHSVHHCSRRLYWLNAGRFHMLDLALMGSCSGLLLAVLGAPMAPVVIVSIIGLIHGAWQHANIRYQLGWFNWLIAGAELHRWHHSKDPTYGNSNYGNNLIIWDVLFGTRRAPDHQQQPEDIGINDTNFPQRWWPQQLQPFRRAVTDIAQDTNDPDAFHKP